MVRASGKDAHWAPREVFQARPVGRRPCGTPRTRWRDYIISLNTGLGTPELVNVALVWGPLLADEDEDEDDEDCGNITYHKLFKKEPLIQLITYYIIS